MRTMIIAAALAVSGCASTQTVLGREPMDVVHSPVPVEQVVFCLQNKFDAAPLEKDGAKIFLHKTNFGVVASSLSVRPEGNGSMIELRRGSTPAYGAFRSCYQPRK